MTTTFYTPTETAEKFTAIRAFQRDERGLVGRETELHVIEVVLATQLHSLLYGKPGVAKSMTIDGILRHIPSVRQFKTQAFKGSPPEQFLGPISIKGMENDEFRRVTTRKVPDVEVAFIDELSRAPRAILPAFQGMMVEREFDSGMGVEHVPLMSLIGAVNHIQDDPELEAFFDRFALKLIVKGPQSQDEFKQIMRGALRRREHGEPDIPDELIVSDKELGEFHRAVERTHVPDAILDSLAELWQNLLGAGIEPSPRRYVDVTKAMQGCARLAGRDEVLLDDMQIAMHALWSMPDEAEVVYKEVVKFASAWVRRKAELIEGFGDLLDRLGQVQSLVAAGTPTTERVEIKDSEGETITNSDGSMPSITDHGIRLANETRSLSEMIEQHTADAQGGDTAELDAVVTQLGAAKEWIQDRLMGGLKL